MGDKELHIDHEDARKKEELVRAIVSGLIATYELHESLGDDGRFAVQSNPFGETALVMDIKAEEVMITALKKTNIPVEVFSEEHDQFRIGDNPEYTVALDGLDGSGEYKGKRGVGMYGTMVSVLEGVDPNYEDYVVNGIMIHSPRPQLLLAVKGQRCFLVDIKTGERKLIQRKSPQDFSEKSRIDLDTYWTPYKTLYDNSQNVFPNMDCRFFSGAARTALFLNGEIDISLEWTRKGNLEQAVNYGLVKELGGVVTGGDGIEIGNKPFRTFGQKKHISLIIAPNQRIAHQVSQRFNLNNITKHGRKKI